MAFIRQYAEAAGDPFRFRVPKRFRKFQPGRALGRVARMALPIAASFIPGAGTALGFARSYGMDVGDAPHPGHRRKMAMAGPKAKAQKKSVRRQAKLSGAALAAHNRAQGRRGLGANLLRGLAGASAMSDKVVGFVGSHMPGPMGAAYNAATAAAGGQGGAYDAAFDEAVGAGATPAQAHGHALRHAGLGRKRHAMNPSNVHALRRSMRRLDGFAKLVKRVTPWLLAGKRSSHGGAVAHRKGHKPGCGCVACRHSK